MKHHIVFFRILYLVLIIIPFSYQIGFSQSWDFVYDSIPSMGRDIVITDDSCYVATSANNPSEQGFSLKLNQQGQVLWFSPYGGNSIKQTFDKGYIIGSSNTSMDALLTKIDSLGNFLWSASFGEYAQDDFLAVIQSSDSCFVAGGFTQSYGDSSLYVIKADTAGNLIWKRSFACQDYGVIRDLIEVDSSYYLVGHHNDLSYNYYLFLAKLTPDGRTIWRKDYQTGFIQESVALTSDSSLIIAGTHQLIKLNLDGDTLWTKSLSEKWFIRSIDITTDNGFIIAGQYRYSNDIYDCNLMAKIDSLGNVEWHKIYFGNDYSECNSFESVKCTSENMFVACGYTNYYGVYKTRIIKTESDGQIVYELENKAESNNVKVFPNPTNGKFIVDIDKFEYIEVFNTDGKQVYKTFDNVIEIYTQPAGVYIIKIITTDGTIIRKVIKK